MFFWNLAVHERQADTLEAALYVCTHVFLFALAVARLCGRFACSSWTYSVQKIRESAIILRQFYTEFTARSWP